MKSLSFSYKDDRNKSDSKSIDLLAVSGFSITKDLIEFKELNKKCYCFVLIEKKIIFSYLVLFLQKYLPIASSQLLSSFKEQNLDFP